MIHAVFESKHDRICYCSITGHAGFADAGQDIVCAAVSSAIQFTANLITEIFQESAEVSAENNLIQIILNAPDSGQGTFILEGLLLHLQCLAEDYPKTIQIKISDSGGGNNA